MQHKGSENTINGIKRGGSRGLPKGTERMV